MTKSSPVCAVIYGPPLGPSSQALADAVAGQSAPPAIVLATEEGLAPLRATGRPITSVAAFTPRAGESRFAAGVRAAVATGQPWLWLLDGRAVPAPDALRSLLSAIDAVPTPAPLLFSSKVLDQQGRLHPDATPRHEIFEKERSVDAVERHLVQLRTATHGSVLVAATAVARFGAPPRQPPFGLDMHEWSARMLRRREDTGYLVPASVAVRDGQPIPGSGRLWWGRVRILGGDAFSPAEKLWETFLLAEDLASAVRAPGGQGRSAVGAPGRRPSRNPRRMMGITRGANWLKRR